MSEYKHTFTRDGVEWTVVVDYEHTARDTYIVEFSGELLRDESLDRQELAAALHAMAAPPLQEESTP